MIKSVLIKKIGYKVLNAVYKKGIPVNINSTLIKLPVDYFRLFPKDYEKKLFSFAESVVKPGDVVLDIGAHIGLMSVLFGKLVKSEGKVFAFEPTPSSFAVLCDTIKFNKLNKVVIPVNMPVTDFSGPVSFYISESNIDVANTLSPWGGKKLDSIDLNAISIDEFITEKNLSKVSFLKIDAEGAEFRVLKGGFKSIAQHRPLISLALHPAAIVAGGDTLLEIFDILTELKYDIFWREQLMNRETFCHREGLFDVHLYPQESTK